MVEGPAKGTLMARGEPRASGDVGEPPRTVPTCRSTHAQEQPVRMGMGEHVATVCGACHVLIRARVLAAVAGEGVNATIGWWPCEYARPTRGAIPSALPDLHPGQLVSHEHAPHASDRRSGLRKMS